jgi:hypothetical protein
MDGTPDRAALALAPETAFSGLPPRHPIRGRRLVTGWKSTCALIALVVALGLVQGSRAALGSAPPAAPSDPAPPPAPAAGARELDPLRGGFFRPAGSDAVRPPQRLRPLAWWPGEAPRLAQASPVEPSRGARLP